MADETAKIVPDALTLQARPPGATRLNRLVIGGGLAVLLLGGGLVTMLALQRPQERPTLVEGAPGPVVLPEGMRGEARYAQAPPTQPPAASPPPLPAPPGATPPPQASPSTPAAPPGPSPAEQARDRPASPGCSSRVRSPARQARQKAARCPRYPRPSRTGGVGTRRAEADASRRSSQTRQKSGRS